MLHYFIERPRIGRARWVRGPTLLDHFQSHIPRHQIEIGIVMNELESMLCTECTDQHIDRLAHSDAFRQLLFRQQIPQNLSLVHEFSEAA